MSPEILERLERLESKVDRLLALHESQRLRIQGEIIAEQVCDDDRLQKTFL